MLKSRDLVSELQRLQLILDEGQAGADVSRAAVTSTTTDGDELAAVEAGIAASWKAQAEAAQAEAKALKRQLKDAQWEVERAEAGAAAARRETEALAAHLRGQLAASQREAAELASALATLQGEAAELRSQLERAEGEAALSTDERASQRLVAEHLRAQQSETEARLTAAQEREAAAREGAASAREREAALARENRELRERLAVAEAALAVAGADERDSQTSSAVQIAQLHHRLALERKWRQAAKVWLSSEHHTKHELERLLLGVSTAIQAGPLPDGSSTTLAPNAAKKAQQGTAGAAEWRRQLDNTMRAFNECSSRLQAELSDVRLQMEVLAAGAPAATA